MKVLLDTSVLRDAVIGEWRALPETVNWGGRQVTNDVAVMRRRPMPPKNQVARRRAILALPTIRRLALEGQLELVTYEELNAEQYVGRNPSLGTRGDLLVGIEPKAVATAVSRSHFQAMAIDKYWTKEAITDFCKMLLGLRPATANAYAQQRGDLPTTTMEAIRDLKRFQDLCRGAPEKLYSDLFHLWTGERNACDYFLTMETKLCNWVEKSTKTPPLCMPIRADTFIGKLGIATLDPMPFEEGEILAAADAMNL